MIKVLNLYAGIGGNRKLWEDVEVTAVEIDPKIAEIYRDFFPNDKVIVTDAHQYLLDHYNDGWDFIWSSPPCITHTGMWNLNQIKGAKVPYPDMNLYQEIILLNHWFDGLYCVENVETYYEPLVTPQKVSNHYFWSNFLIAPFETKKRGIRSNEMIYRDDIIGFDLSNIESKTFKKKILNNCVEPELGLHIFNCAFKLKQMNLEGWSLK